MVLDASEVTLGGSDAMWQAQGLLWSFVVIPFNLSNTVCVAGTCWPCHQTGPYAPSGSGQDSMESVLW